MISTNGQKHVFFKNEKSNCCHRPHLRNSWNMGSEFSYHSYFGGFTYQPRHESWSVGKDAARLAGSRNWLPLCLGFMGRKVIEVHPHVRNLTRRHFTNRGIGGLQQWHRPPYPSCGWRRRPTLLRGHQLPGLEKTSPTQGVFASVHCTNIICMWQTIAEWSQRSLGPQCCGHVHDEEDAMYLAVWHVGLELTLEKPAQVSPLRIKMPALHFHMKPLQRRF